MQPNSRQDLFDTIEILRAPLLVGIPRRFEDHVHLTDVTNEYIIQRARVCIIIMMAVRER
jgi:hypothetical protein